MKEYDYLDSTYFLENNKFYLSETLPRPLKQNSNACQMANKQTLNGSITGILFSVDKQEEPFHSFTRMSD